MIQAAPTEPPRSQLHRANTVRLEQGISIRSLSRRLNISQAEVREMLDEKNNLSLEQLYRLQEALGVPVPQLLVEELDPLSPHVCQRARFVRLAKTVHALLEYNADPCLVGHLQNLAAQVFEMFPEGAQVGAWHSVGQRRSKDEASYRDENPVPVIDGLEADE